MQLQFKQKQIFLTQSNHSQQLWNLPRTCDDQISSFTGHEHNEQTRNLYYPHQLYNEMFNSKIFEQAKTFKTILKSQIVQTDFESNKIKLHYGSIITYINVIITKFEKEFYSQNILGSGSFSIVYKVEFQKQYYVVKQIDTNKNGISNYEQIYKEYFIVLLASVLKFGPKIYKLFGYDIIITKNKAYYAMQLCSTSFPKNYQQLQRIQLQLNNNLKILHSLKLVHLDIKLQNIAFSNIYNKYVFIDFGLSSFIAETYGTKTYTNFKGTLCNCSQQMQKLYLLGKRDYVDLYHNDNIALHKLFKKLKFEVDKNASVSDDPLYEKLRLFYENNYINDILSQCVEVFLIKYFIYQKDYNNIFDIINNLSADSMHITIYNLINFLRNKEQFYENQIIQNFIRNIKQKICENFIANKTDLILADYFITMQQYENKLQLVTLNQILNLSLPLFSQKLKDIQWVYKLFINFNPFAQHIESNSYTNLHKTKNAYKKRNYIISKICASLNFNGQIQIFYLKVRFVLIFFYQSLKSLKNIEILTILRLLFISIQDYVHVQLLEEQILSLLISNNSQKIVALKIIQFYLFWRRIYNDIYYKFEKWKSIIKEIQICSDNILSTQSQILIQVKHFSQSIIKQIQYNKLVSYKQIIKIFSIIQPIQSNLTLKQRQVIQNIKYMCYHVFHNHFDVLQFNFKASSTHFSLYFTGFRKHKFAIPSDYELDFNMTFELLSRIYIRTNNSLQKQIIISFQNYIQCILSVYSQKMSLLIQKLIFVNTYIQIKVCKYSMKQIIPSLQKILAYTKLSTFKSTRQKELLQFQFYFTLTLITFLLKFIRENLSKNLNQQSYQISGFLEEIKNFYFCIQDHLFSSQLSEIHKIGCGILTNFINFIFNEKQQLKQKVQKVVFFFKQSYEKILKNYRLKIFFFQFINQMLQKNKELNDENFHNMILQIGGSDWDKNQLPLFQKKVDIISLYIKLKITKQKEYLKMYQILLIFIQNLYQNEHDSFYIPEAIIIFEFIQIFCISITQCQLQQMFTKQLIVLNLTVRRAIAYFNSMLYYKYFNKLNNLAQKKLLIKTAFFLPNMEIIFIKKLRPAFFKACRKNKIYKNQMKVIKCTKLELKYALYQNDLSLEKLMRHKLRKVKQIQVKNIILNKAAQIDKNCSYSSQIQYK